MISSFPLPLVYHNMIVEHLIGGAGVISSSPLPLVYHNRIVEHLIGEGGGGGVISSSRCHWYIIT